LPGLCILPEEQESLQKAAEEEGFTLHLLCCYSIEWWIVLPQHTGWKYPQKEKVGRYLVSQQSCCNSNKL